MLNDYQDRIFDPQLMRRFDISGPRYTSYPTADRFVEAFDANAYRAWLGKRTIGGIGRPLSLYVHIPFCNTICYYCACNKIVTKNHGRASKYLKYVEREIELQASALDGSHDVVQLHLGGGTPNFLSDEEMMQLMAAIRQHFRLLPGGEYSIELDPRRLARESIRRYAQLGFNRMSVGVQDFDPAVQHAINRIQSVEETRTVIETGREAGFNSVSVDLMYGLPKQGLDSFDRTLDQLLSLSPDRVSIYNYAHMPDRFKPQRRIAVADLTAAEIKLRMLQLAVERLCEAGYTYIGMDHFAKPDDELANAQRLGRLHRNFQGYSTHADSDLLAFGVSAISKVGPSYSQNCKAIDEYYDILDGGHLPVARGIDLTADDLLRRSIIQALMCHFELSIESIEIGHLVDFPSYFAEELEALREMEGNGLVEITPQWITVLPPGRFLVRAIAMVFDRYLRADRERAGYSKII